MNLPAPENPTHWPSVLQLGLSLVGIFLSFGLAFILGLQGLLSASSGASSSQDLNSTSLTAAAALLVGLLLLPSAWYAFLHLIGRPPVAPAGWQRLYASLSNPLALLILAVLAIGLGTLILTYLPPQDWLALPLLHMLAIGAPVALILELGRRGLQAGSRQKEWAIFGLGLTIGPIIILALEIGVLILGAIVFLVVVYSQPALISEIMRLVSRLRAAGNNPEELLRILQPFLARPAVVFAIFAYVAGIVPLIEEAIKPIGAWLLVGSNPTPVQGFVAGLLSGAGYALFENLSITQAASAEWPITVTVRAGTALLHVMTAGISGWALAGAWSQGRFRRLALVYLGMVLIHGTWNGLALLSTAFQIGVPGFGNIPEAQMLVILAIALTILIGVSMFILLLFMNYSLRKREQPSLIETV